MTAMRAQFDAARASVATFRARRRFRDAFGNMSAAAIGEFDRRTRVAIGHAVEDIRAGDGLELETSPGEIRRSRSS